MINNHENKEEEQLQQQQNDGKENDEEERATITAAVVRREFVNLIIPAVEFFRLFNKNRHFLRYENYRYWIKMC